MLLCSIAIRHSVRWLVEGLSSSWLCTVLARLNSSNMPGLKCSIIDLTSHRLFPHSFFPKDNGIAVGTIPSLVHSEERRKCGWKRGW